MYAKISQGQYIDGIMYLVMSKWHESHSKEHFIRSDHKVNVSCAKTHRLVYGLALIMYYINIQQLLMLTVTG